MSEQSDNRPVKKFRAGGISASIWRNETKQKDQSVVSHSVTVQKRYCDKNGQWQTSGSFFQSDLPKVELVVRKAYEYLALREAEEAQDAPF